MSPRPKNPHALATNEAGHLECGLCGGSWPLSEQGEARTEECPEPATEESQGERSFFRRLASLESKVSDLSLPALVDLLREDEDFQEMLGTKAEAKVKAPLGYRQWRDRCIRSANQAAAYDMVVEHSSFRTIEQFRAEHEETRRYLRTACGERGDNGWPDDLHLMDIIDKHLLRYWPSAEPRPKDVSIVGIDELAKRREENSPHVAGEAKCMDCGHRWVAVAPTAIELLECPSCELVRGRFIHPYERHEVEHWTCGCGCDLFHVTPSGLYCPGCGADQAGF